MLSLYHDWVATGDALYQSTCPAEPERRGYHLAGATGAVANRIGGAGTTRADGSGLCAGPNGVRHSCGFQDQSTQSGTLRFQGPGVGCPCRHARSARTRSAAVDPGGRQDLDRRLGLSETQRTGLCAGVVDDAPAGQTHTEARWGGGTPAVAGTRDGFQDLVGASREAAQDPVLSGAARSG